jgi:hypothetical protein
LLSQLQWETKKGEFFPGPAWVKGQDPASKISRAIRAAGMAQMVQCLPQKYKALSSIPNVTKEKRKEKKETHLHPHHGASTHIYFKPC